ncbi:MAG TPA: hypothetical protein VH105_06050 [Burkholderiales bacterium]|nr:hypothetical protein [Burkholderiales bacterium]
MKPTTAANLSIALVWFAWMAWLCSRYAEGSAQDITAEQVHGTLRTVFLFAGAAAFFLIGAVWFSGYGWAAARKRAAASLAACTLTLGYAVYQLVR